MLELLADAPDGLTTNDIVQRLNHTMGEVYRIVVYLHQRGYLQQDGLSGRYASSLRPFELAHRHPPTNRLVKLAILMLEVLAIDTEQSCHLAVLYQTSVLILASAASPRPAGYSVKAGAMFRLRDTSSGIVILAFSRDSQQEHVLADFDAPRRKAIRRRSTRVACDGFERTPSCIVHGVVNPSVPVFDESGAVGAITMGYIRQIDPKTAEDEALNPASNRARHLSKQLAGVQPSGRPSSLLCSI